MVGRRTYSVEVPHGGTWFAIIPATTRGYCLGYLHAHSTAPGPTLAMRVMDSTGREVERIEANDVVSIGQVAGFPTAEQYERAGHEALERARLIRERAAERESRRGR